MTNYPYKRCDIVIYDFGASTVQSSKQAGRRPAVVLSQDVNAPTALICPLTKIIKKPSLPCHVVLGQRFGLLVNSMLLAEQLTVADKASFGPIIGHIDDPHIVRLIDAALCNTLGIQSRFCHSDSSSSEEVPV